jgi:hypothetical protein
MSSPSPFMVSTLSEQPFTSDIEDLTSPFRATPSFSQEAFCQTPNLSQDDVLNDIETPTLEELLRKQTKSPNKRYVIWKAETASEWHQWWTAKLVGSINRELFQHMVWTESKRSPIWKLFYQGAEIRTGCPKAICQYCWKAFAHPELRRGGSSTSTLTRHTKSKACNRKVGGQSVLQMVSCKSNGSE